MRVGTSLRKNPNNRKPEIHVFAEEDFSTVFFGFEFLHCTDFLVMAKKSRNGSIQIITKG